MINRLYCCLPQPPPATSRVAWRCVCLGFLFFVIACLPRAAAGADAPQWMRAQVWATLPDHDEKTDAVLMYSETDVTVIAADKIKTTVREAYKILRPNGRERGTVRIY